MFVGIDPGKNGGIVHISKTINYYFIPKIGNEVDVLELSRIIEKIKNSESCEVHFFIEKVHAVFGSAAKATFNFGYVCGLIEGIVSFSKCPYTMIEPKVWQKEMFQGIPIIKKSGSKRNDTKKMAEIAYKRLFPNIDFYITENENKSKKVHDGLVDALLIADYGRRILRCEHSL
jgi:hypothetical protein